MHPAQDGQAISGEAGLPRWQQPFVANPGVRYFRTPDRRLPQPAPAQESVTVAPPPAPEPRDLSDLSDWSESQPWFGGDDWSSVDVWASLEPVAESLPRSTAVAAPVETCAVAMPLDVSLLRAPPRPVYGLDRLVRFDQPPRPAEGQDNGLAVARSAAPATEPARSALSLVFGPQPETPAAPRRPAFSAMAARAAIRSAATPPMEPAPLPAPEQTFSAPVFSAPAFAPAEPRAERTEERVVIPMAARPVLLRGRFAPAPEPEPAPAPEVAELALVPVEEPQAVTAEAVPETVTNLPLVAARPRMIAAPRHLEIASFASEDYELPALDLLALPAPGASEEVDADVLEQNALNLQQTVQDFGVRGDILAVRPARSSPSTSWSPPPAPSRAA